RARVVRAARADEDVVQAEVQEVADLVELIERAGLVVEVVEDALHARVAVVVLTTGGPARARRVVAGAHRPGVLLDRPAGIVDVLEELREIVGDLRRRAPRLGERLDLVLAAIERLAAGLGRAAERDQRALRRAGERRHVGGELV